MPQWFLVMGRSFILMICLFLLTKWLGKRQISQLSFFEYITGITIGSIAAEASSSLDRNFWHGLVSMLVWAVIPFIIGFVSLKSKGFRNFFEGEGTLFIKDGKVLEDNLKKEKYTTDELLELLRRKNIFHLADVEFAVLEPGGELTALLKRDRRPLTPKDIGLPVAMEKEPQTVIMDGEILDGPLSASGHNRRWLLTELEKLQISADNVFLGQVDSFGTLTVDLYDDKLQVNPIQKRPAVLATLKKCQADLELFALETLNEHGKETYRESSEKLVKLIGEVQDLLSDD